MADEFLDVFGARVVLRIARVLEDDEVPGRFKDRHKNINDLRRGGDRRDSVENGDEFPNRCRHFHSQAEVVHLPKGRAERQSVVVGKPLNG